MLEIEQGRVEVYTYKDGILARAAHDLRLSVGRFDIRGSAEHVEASFDVGSVRVDGAMRNGVLDERALGESDRRDILENMRERVLGGRPIRFEGKAESQADGGYRVVGDLELVGRRRPLTLTLAAREDHLEGEVELTPSLWGIKPFKALMGAIKLQDRVRVRFDLPAPR